MTRPQGRTERACRGAPGGTPRQGGTVTRDPAFGDRPSSRAASRAGGAPTTADRARRTLSQNFLADRHAIDLVIRAADPAGLVLEPGAGAGALTLALAGAGALVIGYEIDPRLAQGQPAEVTGRHDRGGLPL
ncbi:hypothetical protein JYK22_10500 [Nonomuraea sp. RK-328]|nr:hypothetical protein [Nonomuraea sp. RK-328]